MKPDTPVASIDDLDLEILLSGAEETTFTTSRNFWLGIAASAGAGAVGVFAAVDFWKIPDSGSVPLALICAFALSVLTVAAGILGIVRGLDAAKAKKKTVYRILVDRLRKELETSKGLVGAP